MVPDLGDMAGLLHGLSDAEVALLVEGLPDSAIVPLGDAVTASLTTPKADLHALVREYVGDEYIRRPHTDVLIDALQLAVERADQGEDTKLIISMPPGSGKSVTSSVVFPLWLLLNRPDWEIGLISAEASLATKFSSDVRNAYDEMGVVDAEGGKTEWRVKGHTGGILARGIKGSIVGRRLRVAIIDDPIRHLADAYSETIRETAWQLWQGAIKTRMRPGSIVLSIATRWHDDDLNGRLIKQAGAGWEQIIIPALAEEDDAIGRKPGDPLLSVQQEETPGQAAARWDQTKTEVGSSVFNALYQQRPGDPMGTVFLMEWWRYYTELPEPDQIITSWDLTFGTAKGKKTATATTGTGSGDWCVGQAWQRTGSRYFLLDQIRFRGGFTVQIAKMKAFIARFPTAHAHVVEQAANGAAAIETLQAKIPGVVGEPVTATSGSKVVRAQAVSPLMEAHQVELPSGRGFVDDYLFELTAFPTGKHDDQVDATTQALKRLRASDVGPVTVQTDRGRLGGW